MTKDGILTEACDALDRNCDDNGKQFKGIFLRYLMDLADTTGADRYREFVRAQAASIWDHDRDVANRLGCRWSGGTNDDHPNSFDWRTQASALSALIAAVPERVPDRSLSATLSPARTAILPNTGEPTTVELDLAVLATGKKSRPLDGTIVVKAPDGWTVDPDRDRFRVITNGNAKPADHNVPVTVEIPADTKPGTYEVTATVTGTPRLTFTAQAEIQVARTIDFDTGTAAEIPWLFDADGSGNNGPTSRFADGTSYFIYRFPFPSGTTEAKATIMIENEYLVEASPDGKIWTEVLREDQEIKDGSNKAEHPLDLTPYLKGTAQTNPVYLRFRDSFPNDGWGGRLYHVTADFN